MDGGSATIVRHGDIELVLRWAFSQTSYVRCESATDRGLLFNHGYSAVPAGCHGLYAGGVTAVVLRRNGMADAATIVEAVERLDPYTRSLVTRCAQKGVRPDCMLGAEPVRVPVTKRSKRGHRRVVGSRWHPCRPETVQATREVYSRWHVTVGRLAADLSGKLSGWRITGFFAEAEPWLK